MQIEPHTPSDKKNPCKECVLSHGMMCLDRSYCKFKETGKTWKKSLAPPDAKEEKTMDGMSYKEALKCFKEGNLQIQDAEDNNMFHEIIYFEKFFNEGKPIYPDIQLSMMRKSPPDGKEEVCECDLGKRLPDCKCGFCGKKIKDGE